MSGVATPRNRVTQAAILAVVLGLHALLGWLLVISTSLRSIQSNERRLDIFFITPTAAPPDLGAPPANTDVDTRPREDSAATHRRNRASTPSLAQDRTAGAHPGLSATQAALDHPPVDWAGELSRTAQAAAALPGGPQPKEFGYPHAHESPPATPPEFGWSHTQTHRVEAIPGGGLLVNLNDNCVLILAFPIPFAACKLGKRPANGDLFKHMHDPPADAGPHDTD